MFHVECVVMENDEAQTRKKQINMKKFIIVTGGKRSMLTSSGRSIGEDEDGDSNIDNNNKEVKQTSSIPTISIIDTTCEEDNNESKSTNLNSTSGKSSSF